MDGTGLFQHHDFSLQFSGSSPLAAMNSIDLELRLIGPRTHYLCDGAGDYFHLYVLDTHEFKTVMAISLRRWARDISNSFTSSTKYNKYATSE